MMTALVQFKLPASITRDKAQEIFLDAAPRFRNIPGLSRKYFLLSEDGRTAGGVYLWKSQEDAERFYTDDFKTRIVARYGFEPSIIYFQSPVVVDNLTGEVFKDG